MKPSPESMGGLTPLAVDAKTIAAICGMARSTWLELHGRGLTPEPIRLGSERAAPKWSVDEIRAWIASGCPSAERWAPRWRKMIEAGIWASSTIVSPTTATVPAAADGEVAA